jgi:hypothetical protein
MPMNSFTFDKHDRDDTQTGAHLQFKDLNPNFVSETTIRKERKSSKEKSRKNRSLDDVSEEFGFSKISSKQDRYEAVNIENLVRGYNDPEGRRKAPRFEVKMTVVIYSANRSFRAQTLNVSAGGVMLDKILPEGFGSEKLDILLISEEENQEKKSYFMMKGESVGAPLRSNRVKFLAANSQTRQTFESFITDLAV